MTDWLTIFSVTFAAVASTGGVLVAYAIHNEQRLTRLETKVDLILDIVGVRKTLKQTSLNLDREQ
jgi:hypothetical protein